MKKIITYIFIFQTSLLCFSQEIYKLDLEKSIEIAKEQSFRIRILNMNLERSEHVLEAATRRFKTKMTFDFNGPRYAQAINKTENDSGRLVFNQTNKLYYGGELIINQPLPTDGSIYLSSVIDNTNDYQSEENALELQTILNFRQPIQALYSYNRIRTEFDRAALNYEAAERSQKREELNLIYDVSQIFYNLLNAKQRKEIAEQVLIRQTEASEIAQNKYDAGLIREVEALQIEVDLGQAQNDYDLATSNYESQANYFKQSLGLALSDSVILESEMDYHIVLVDIERAILHGLANRQEIREREIEIELNKIDLKMQKSEGQISGEINAYYGLQGVRKNDLPVVFGTAINESYQTMIDGPNSYGFGINIHIPIIDWGENKSRVKAIKSSQDIIEIRLEEQKMTIEREIRNTINQLESALRRLQLLEKNVELAEKSFEISQYRFKNGDIDSEALALDRERLNKTHLSHLEAYISYKLLIADLMRKTFYDFEKDQPIL